MEGPSTRHRLRTAAGGDAEDGTEVAAVKKERDGKLPAPIQLTGTRFKLQRPQFSSVDLPDGHIFSEEDLRKVVVLNDPGNFIIVNLHKRGHRRYTTDKSLPDDSYYVGIDTNEFTPAFTRSVTKTSLKANTYENAAHLGWGSKSGGLIVPPIDMLRPNQLLFVKHLSIRYNDADKYRNVSDSDRSEYQKRQQDAFSKGHPCPVLVNDEVARPDYATLQDTKEGTWKHFRMMMPKIAGRKVPKGLVDEIKAFLAKHNRDIVSANFALTLAIIYHHYYQAADLGAEKGGKQPVKPVPEVSLAQLILYGPHYFRLHEDLKLSAYVHIFRAVDHLYGKDKKINAFAINEKDIDETLVSEYIDEMALTEKDWQEIVPPSWEGSKLTMPLNHGSRAPASAELTAMLMMPDIYTLGFAGYTNYCRAKYSTTTRETLMHGFFVPEHIRSNPDLWRLVTDGDIGPEALEPYQDQLDHQVWTAPKMAVRLPWPEVPTVDAGLRGAMMRSWATQTSPEPGVEPGTGESAAIVPPISHHKMIQDTTAYYKAFIAKIRKGQDANLIDKSVTIGSDGHLTWPGLDEQPGTSRKLPDEINMQDIIAEYDNAGPDRISETDRCILRRLFLEDLAEDKHVAQCARDFKSCINIEDINLGVTQEAHDLYADLLVQSCTMLLGLNVATDGDGGGDEKNNKNNDTAIAAIRAVDRDLANALTTFNFLVPQLGEDGAKSVFDLTMKLVSHSPCFEYWYKLMLLAQHINGKSLDEESKESWIKLFGEPYTGEVHVDE
ncbi:hypothetical protein CORC01_13000 [Colletotrichum orchidophilum]|uniref:Uncharacterized protein n=1 Tax=Colletotrichum orchidophilum TaxID=1209926 RepID=A0A1G4ARC6_9PEZI|nr:uncharacterized protein CORC01_13000 [Colletotrichum orchidophilum]OHE91709.1 hypothetical protein CORC01_13000 [Colletotrichum orchidophilum]